MRKRVKLIIGACCLLLAIMLSQVPASYVKAVSPITDFERKEDKLISYTGTAEAVSVPSGIKTICEDAFAGNHHMKSVSIPPSVEVIENGAFRDCDQLEIVLLSSGLSEIGSGAFSLCDNLKSFTLSDTVLKIGAGVFAGDTKLKGIDTSKNPYFHCDNGVLFDREYKTLIQYFSSNRAEEFIMPSSVEEIERYSFWGCQNLEQVKLSPYLYSIPEFAFSNCRDLKEVDVPYSVRKIDAKAFEDCVRLKTMSIPVSVTSIHDTAFDGCRGLRIIAEEGTYAKTYYEALKEKQTDELNQNQNANEHTAIGMLYGSAGTSVSGNHISDNAIDNSDLSDELKNQINDLHIYNPQNPADVSKLDVSAYYAQDGDDVLGKTRVVGNAAVIIPSQSKLNQVKTLEEEEKERFEPDMMIQDNGSHKILKKMFYEDQTLSKVTTEDGINSYEDFAFSRSTMTGILIPEGVEKIGYGCFYHCDNLDTIIIPKSVNEILPQAFAFTPFLQNWERDSDADDFLVVGNGILIGYKGDGGNITIPSNVKKIAGGVFKDREDIYKVNFDDGLIEIGEEAFAGCTSLVNLSSLGHIKKIADRAFDMCPLTKVHIGNDMQYIGLSAFPNTTADAVIFEALQELPKLSYEQTATRYDNGGFRAYPFGNLQVAGLAGNVPSFEDTILDEDYLGFRGLVVSFPNGIHADTKNCKLEYCTMLPAYGELNLKIPSSIAIDGSLYTITAADANAFSPYTHLKDWSDTVIGAIILPDTLGQISDYEPELVLGSVSETQSEETGNTSDALEKNIETTDESETLSYTSTIVLGSSYPQADGIKGEILDDTNEYLLYVSNSDEEYDLQDAVTNLYGNSVNGQLTTFDLKLMEKNTKIPISNLGQNQMKLTIPISKTLYEQDICAVSLDHNMQLQMHYGIKSQEDDRYYFTFHTNHFSPYGIYVGIGTQAEMIRKQSDALLSLDDSPDTGEKINPFIILAIAIGCVGCIFLINGSLKKSL